MTASLLKPPGLVSGLVLSNAVVWIVSTLPPTSKSCRPFNNPLVTVPNAPITIGIIFTPGSADVFNWSFSESKSPQVSRTLPSILADLNNAVVWMISTSVLLSSRFTNLFVTVLNAPITIGITVTFMFHSFFSFQARSRHISLSSSSFNFTLWSPWTTKFTIRQVFCHLSIGLVVWPRLGDPFVYQNPENFMRLVIQDGFRVVHIPLVSMSSHIPLLH